MLIALRLPSRRPDFAVCASLYHDAVEGARRRPVEHIAGLHIKRSFVTRAFESPVLFLEIDGAGQMCAFLAVSVIFGLGDAHENRRVFLRGIAKVKGGAD